MKLLVTTLMAFTLCMGCASQDVPVTPMPKPEVMSEFKVGDNIIVLFPNLETMNGQVTKVGLIAEWLMPDGSIQTSRGYTVSLSRLVPITNENGDTVYMTVIIESGVPEFAMVLQKRPSEKK